MCQLVHPLFVLLELSSEVEYNYFSRVYISAIRHFESR